MMKVVIVMERSIYGKFLRSLQHDLIPLELDHVVPDELHLFLRNMDILMENLTTQAVKIDKMATKKKSDPLLGETLCKLQAAIQSCGVSFHIWDDSF